MADIFNSNPNNGELFQLEAKRKSDSSWHPCHLSLRPTGGLAVKYEGQDLEDIILNGEDALASLRVRSSPLQGDDCCHIEGENVLAAYEKNSEKLFFDAVVEKVLKVRHSKRAICRCSFKVKWLFHNVDEISTIPSASIMKLADKNIKSHPIVAEFLDSVESSFLFSTGSDEIDHEIDVNGLLGMHIKEMDTLIDLTKSGLFKDVLLGGDHGVGFGGREAQTKSRTSKRACKLQAKDNYRPKQLRSSTKNKKEMKTKDEDPKTNTPLCGSQNRSRLNPLAARAVLASLVSQTPQKIGVLHQREEKHTSLDLTNEMMMSPVHKSHHVHNIDDSEPTNTVNKVKSLSKKEETRDKESTHPLRKGRVIRSVIKQENGALNGEVKSTLLDEGVTSIRVTRSGAHKRNVNMAYDVQEHLSSKPRRVSRRDSTEKEIESGISKIEDSSQSFSDKTNSTTLTSTTRVTRSTARKQSGTFDGCVKQSLHDKFESIKSDNCVSDFEGSEKKRASPLVGVKLKSAERNKKQKVLNDVDQSQNTTVESPHADVENQSSKKRISSQNQLSQSSLHIICGLLAVGH